MNTYHVTYYYCASGIADTADYGHVMASSAREAVDIVGRKLHPDQKDDIYRNWGLSATLVQRNLFPMVKST